MRVVSKGNEEEFESGKISILLGELKYYDMKDKAVITLYFTHTVRNRVVDVQSVISQAIKSDQGILEN